MVTRFWYAPSPGRSAAAIADFPSLWRWSIDHRKCSGARCGSYAGVIGEPGARTLIDPDRMPGARWFPDASLNFARNLLERRASMKPRTRSSSGARTRCAGACRTPNCMRVGFARRAALIAHGVDKRRSRRRPTCRTCRRRSSRCSARPRSAASGRRARPISACRACVDRFGQIEPTRACSPSTATGTTARPSRRCDKVAADRRATAHGRRVVVVVPYLQQAPGTAEDFSERRHARRRGTNFSRRTPPAPIAYASLPFDHPLYILYSSGTTGVPKCIVHGAGGTLLQHLKEHLLHGDVKTGDRLFYFTTCGWMMWNWLASGSPRGATLLLYDGSPFIDRGRVLWDFADAEKMTHFGTSAKYIDAIKKIALVPRKNFDSRQRAHDVLDRQPARAGKLRLRLPVHQGRHLPVVDLRRHRHHLVLCARVRRRCRCGAASCSAAAWAMDVDVFDEDGKLDSPAKRASSSAQSPFPSMPIGFWNDPDGAKYRAAYFERFPGVWCHGDWVELTEHDGMIIYGRSDATLNPGGVRIGTAEIYRQVEQLAGGRREPRHRPGLAARRDRATCGSCCSSSSQDGHRRSTTALIERIKRAHPCATRRRVTFRRRSCR